MLSMRLVAPRLVVDVNGISELAYVRSTEAGDAGSGPPGVHVGALARHADVEADPDAARVQPLLGQRAPAGRPPDDPQPRHHRGVDRPRRRLGGDARRALPPGRPRDGGLAGGPAVDPGTTSCSSARSRPRCDPASSRSRRSSRPCRPAAAWRSTRWPGGTGTTRCAAWPRSSSCPPRPTSRRRRCAPATCRCATCPRWSTSPRPTGAVCGTTPTPTAGDLALSRLDPGDDIHATAAYRSQLVRTLTRRTVEAAYADARARLTAGSRR